MDDTALPEPQKGGSYSRNADGSLTLVQHTAERPMRDKRDDEAAAAAPAPAPAADAKE